MSPHKETILRALNTYRGDDLERAKNAFKNCTPEEMHEEYGSSGKTRAELLADYRRHVAKVEAAVKWLEGIA